MTTTKSMIRKSVIAVAVVAGLTAAAATFATAQPGPACSPGMMGMHGGAGHGPGMMAMRGGPMFSGSDADIAKFQQDRIAQLKTTLAITAEQQPAWDAFAAKAAEQAKNMQSMRKDAATGTAPERMQQRQQFMAERQKAMTSMGDALTALYQVLTPKQREIFDAAHGPMHRRG
jgi:Spy/CpxP family protein refolding chaperone